MRDHYPAGVVRALLQTTAVTDATRQALTDRLEAPAHEPVFFSVEEHALLRTICDRLIPPTPDAHSQPIDVAGGIDQRLSEGKSDGWRYDTMPADREAYKRGLQGVNETAQALFGRPFQQLNNDQQDEVLQAIQTRQAPGTT